MNECTQTGAYHERAANGNSRVDALIKNFHFGLIGSRIDGQRTASPVFPTVFLRTVLPVE